MFLSGSAAITITGEIFENLLSKGVGRTRAYGSHALSLLSPIYAVVFQKSAGSSFHVTQLDVRLGEVKAQQGGARIHTSTDALQHTRTHPNTNLRILTHTIRHTGYCRYYKFGWEMSIVYCK